MNLPPHPHFRDVLWDVSRTSALADTLTIRVFSNDEELFDKDEQEEGFVWKVPSGLIPRSDPQRAPVVAIDRPTAMSIGQKLWMSLPDPVRARTLASGSLPVRLKISGEVREVTYMPWECMPMPPNALVARSVPVPYPIPPLTVKPPLRVLFIISNPKDEQLLRSSEELNAVRMVNSADYSTDVTYEATLSGITSELERIQPHIVHYVGHSGVSTGQGYLILHDERANTAWVGPAQLSKVLPSSVRLLCLSTCFTGENYDIRGLPLFAQAPADVSLPTSVVNRLPLDMASEPTIKQFWRTFYAELRSGKGDAASAFRTAKATIAQSSDCVSFSLVLRDGTGWSLAIDESVIETDSARDQIFDTLYSNTIANYLTQQITGSSSEVRRVLREHSRTQVQRGLSADPNRTFTWPRKD